jgi:hypothetical protein
MEYNVRSRSKRTKAFLEHLLPSMISQLGLENCRKPLYINVDKNLVDDCNYGMTSYLQRFDCIVVILKPCYHLERLGLTLAHEMVHVKQIAKGKLKTVKGISFWNGKKYSNKTKYLDQPWEIEAFSKQELIFRRAID